MSKNGRSVPAEGKTTRLEDECSHVGYAKDKTTISAATHKDNTNLDEKVSNIETTRVYIKCKDQSGLLEDQVCHTRPKRERKISKKIYRLVTYSLKEMLSRCL